MFRNPVFESLYEGTYLLKVHTADLTCDDFASQYFTINSSPEIEIGLTPVNATCFENNDGQITASVQGGSGLFSYSWDYYDGTTWFPAGSNSSSVSGLQAGTYRLNVKDSKDCRETMEIALTEPPSLLIENAVPHDVICFGGTGSIEIKASGGTGGYQYSCYGDAGQLYQDLSPEISVPVGDYYVKLKDSNGCETVYGNETEDFHIKINGPDSPLDFSTAIPEFNGFNVSCFGDATGTVAIEASGGNGVGYSGYTYSLSQANIPDQTSGLFTNLEAGIYNVTVTDARGCMSGKSVELVQPPQLALSLLSVEPVKCFGSSTGKISVEAFGGAGSFYSYQLNGMESLTSGVFNNLYADKYEIAVTDLNGCKKNLFAAVEHKNLPIETTIVSQNVRCSGEFNGEISANISGGSGVFTTIWEKKADDNWQSYRENVNILEELGPGNYRLKVTDSDDCILKDSTIINEPDILSINRINLHDIICYGETGSIEIGAEGGNAGYKYLYSEKDDADYTEFNSGTPLNAGIYKLKVADSKGCEITVPESLTITQPDKALELNYYLKDFNDYNVSCFGNDDGLIAVTPSGGNGNPYSGYSYLLSGRPLQKDSLFAGLQAGTYDLSLIDGRGCKITKQVTLTQAKSELYLGASSVEQPVCIDDANGRITLNTLGGKSPYAYSINNASLTGNEFTNLKVGNYHFMVKDANGCSQVFDTSLVNTVPEMEIKGIISDAGCFGQNSGAINVNISGGVVPFTYRWKNNPSVSPFIDNLYKGIYTVSVTDAAGCMAEKMFEIHEPVLPLSVTAVSQSACVLTPNGTIIPSADGGTSPYMFAIDGRSHFSSSPYFNAYAGRHTVFVSDANNCIAEAKIDVGERNIMPYVNFMIATSRYELDTLVIIDVSVPVPDKVTWEFSPEAVVIDTGLFDARIKYNYAGVYPVKMTGHFGTCNYTTEKLLNIAPFDPLTSVEDKNHKGIKSMKITPNPNDGHFELKIELFNKQPINIKVFDYYSRLLFNEMYPTDIEFLEEINLPDTKPGTYVIWIISENDARSAVFVISE